MKTDYYSCVHVCINRKHTLINVHTHTHAAEIKPRHTHTRIHKALEVVCGGVSVSVAVAAEWRMGDDLYADGRGGQPVLSHAWEVIGRVYRLLPPNAFDSSNHFYIALVSALFCLCMCVCVLFFSEETQLSFSAVVGNCDAVVARLL